jgi:hypothetical protein
MARCIDRLLAGVHGAPVIGEAQGFATRVGLAPARATTCGRSMTAACRNERIRSVIPRNSTPAASITADLSRRKEAPCRMR